MIVAFLLHYSCGKFATFVILFFFFIIFSVVTSIGVHVFVTCGSQLTVICCVRLEVLQRKPLHVLK